MNKNKFLSVVTAVGMIFLLLSTAVDAAPPTLAERDSATGARLIEAYGKLPLSFQANQGQANDQVKFLSRGRGYSLFLTSTGAVLALHKSPGPNTQHGIGTVPTTTELKDTHATGPTVLRMTLLGANRNPRVSGLEELPGKVNYFIGNDPKKWQTNIPTYAKVKYQDVYPGVDLIYYGNQRQLEYDLIVAPGADPKTIMLGFEGADKLEIDAQGNLVLYIAGSEVIQRTPLIYQEINGAKQAIPGRYVLKGQDRVGFQVAKYDTSKPLVIDPVLSYSTYLGGSSDDQGLGITVDASGNAYVTGRTNSLVLPIFPPEPGPLTSPDGFFQPSPAGGYDAFVVKLNADGSALVYGTYLGGSYDEGLEGYPLCFDIAVDSSGSAYVTGHTRSPDFPITEGAFDTDHNGGSDAFVTKLDPTGSNLEYSTFLGGSGNEDYGWGIAVDAEGNAYVTGVTNSNDFPITPGAFDTTYSLYDAFVTKLDPTGSSLEYSTFLGGIIADGGRDIAVDAEGNAYVTGHTFSNDFPTTIGAFDTDHNGGSDAFVTKLDPTGSSLEYSTFLGGDGNLDEGFGLAVDAQGNIYVTGVTNSSNFPTTSGAFDTTYSLYDAFVTKLDPTGSSLEYSTFLGGSNDHDYGRGIAVDSSGNAYVTGYTFSNDFPTTAGAFDTDHNGGSDAFVTKLDPTGSSLEYSTFLGGSGNDYGRGIALDAEGNIYVTGYTFSNDFPTERALQPTFGGGAKDAFVTKLDTIVPTWPPGSTLTASNVGLTRLTLTWTPAEDNTGVEDYRVYQDGTLLDTLAGDVLTYDVTGLTASTLYEFKVEAGDATGNWSTDGPSVTVTTLTPQETIILLIDEVETLVTEGALNQGQGNSLIAKLEDAIQHLNREKEKPAIKKLEEFISQVNAFIHAGVLLPEEGQPLIDAANDIINQLNC